MPAPVLVEWPVDCTSAYSHGTRGSTRRASRMSLACGAGFPEGRPLEGGHHDPSHDDAT
jgi:hypothetical protein